MIALLLLNLLVGYCAYIIVFKLMRIKGAIASLLAFSALYFAQIVLTELILGMMGKLFLSRLFMLNLLAALFFSSCCRYRQTALAPAGIKSEVAGLLKNRVVLLLFSLIAGFAAVKGFINLINPPFGWDNLSYHFVFPVEWLKSGTLDNPITLCDDPSMPYYPINASLFFLWFMLPLKNVFLADLGQLPFFAVSLAAVYGIARKLGASKEHAFYGAAMFVLTPNVFKQIEIAYVDVMFASVFLAGLYFLCALNEKFEWDKHFLWSVCMGLLLGIKSSAVIFGAVLVPLYALLLAKNSNHLRLKRTILYLFCFAITVLVLGGYTYIRNYLATGNPMYPAEVKILGRLIFSGVMPIETYRQQWTSSEFNLEKILFHEGMGAQLLLIFMPLVLVSIPVALRKLKGKLGWFRLYIFCMPFALYMLFAALMPQLNLRYAYNVLGAGYAVAAYTLTLLNLPAAIVRAVVSVCALASVSEYSGHGELAASLILSALLFVSLKWLFMFKFGRAFKLAIFMIMFASLYAANLDYGKHEYSRYLDNTPFPKEDREAWYWLNQNTCASNIAYAGIPHVLPLYGANFKNRVLYVSVNSVHPAKLHYFKGSQYFWSEDFMKMYRQLETAGHYRENPDYKRWLANLKVEGINYLVVYSLRKIKNGDVFPVEGAWADDHAQTFRPVFIKNSVRIYKVLN